MKVRRAMARGATRLAAAMAERWTNICRAIVESRGSGVGVELTVVFSEVDVRSCALALAPLMNKTGRKAAPNAMTQIGTVHDCAFLNSFRRPAATIDFRLHLITDTNSPHIRQRISPKVCQTKDRLSPKP